MSFLKTFVLGVIICVAALIVNAQGEKAALIHTVDSILNSQVNHDKIPGAVVEIKQGGEIVMLKAFGYAQKYDYGHHALKNPPVMTTGTLFDLASLTKVVGTTTSIMLLVDRGLIHVDDPVSKYVPAFGSPDKAAITIRHLL
ncbi:MAG TPA: serine hydrolase domain-containing protein, partial [Mucilaginibacter sp.]